MQNLMSRMRAAMEKYEMIQKGDRIAVGLSGGKDSVALLAALAQMRRFYPHSYELVAISLDMGFNEGGADFSHMEKLCRDLGVEYHIRRSSLAQVIFENRKEKNPCSLCAKMRRGILHDLTKEQACNKLALGHHMDDAAETFMMNLLNGGNIGSFRPMTYLSRKDITLIRPMIFAREQLVISAVRREGLPVLKNPCPIDGHSERQKMKDLLREMEREYPALRDKIIGSMQRRAIDGW